MVGGRTGFVPLPRGTTIHVVVVVVVHGEREHFRERRRQALSSLFSCARHVRRAACHDLTSDASRDAHQEGGGVVGARPRAGRPPA